MTEIPTEPPAAPAPARSSRGRESVGDMVRSLSLVLVVVGVVFLLTLRDEPKATVHPVDYTAQLQVTRGLAAYDVLAPVGLGKGWKATSARADTVDGVITWHLGLVTPDGRYAAVEQSDGPVTGFLSDHVDGARRSGAVTIAGVRWERQDGGNPEHRALVLRGSGVTTMVAGSASYAQLRQLAASLRGS